VGSWDPEATEEIAELAAASDDAADGDREPCGSVVVRFEARVAVTLALAFGALAESPITASDLVFGTAEATNTS
jgi:hypothetical protein